MMHAHHPRVPYNMLLAMKKSRTFIGDSPEHFVNFMCPVPAIVCQLDRESVRHTPLQNYGV
eukprot:c45092_g1_i1 orf=112-294(-)